MEQVLRHIEEKTLVLPAYMIARLGWGRTITTGKAAGIAGAIYTSAINRAFRMVCGCVISRPEDSGAPCAVCRNELMLLIARAAKSSQVSVNLEEVNWSASPCKLHFSFCSVPLCSIGCCIRHAGQLPDMKSYCATHFHQVQQELQYRALVQEKGVLRVEAARFVSALFSLPKP